MKKVFIFILAISMMTVSLASADFSLDSTIVLYVDSNMALVNDNETQIDENVNVTPIVENGRTLIPVRFIGESFGMTVNFNEQSRGVSLINDTYNIRFTIGSSIISVNGEERLIDPENESIIAKTENGRTLIPMRSLAEAVGKTVVYDRGLIIITEDGSKYNVDGTKSIHDRLISRLNVLPKVGSVENLEKLIEESTINHYGYDMRTSVMAPTMESAVAMDSAASSGGGSANRHSETNVQVEGVDEADLVKTDGNYIYQVSENKVVITSVSPVTDMQVKSTITFDDESFHPTELYIDGDKLSVLGYIFKYQNVRPAIGEQPMAAPAYVMPSVNYSKVVVYDVSDRSNPIHERDLEVEGNYLSSRKIGDYVYMLRTKYHYWSVIIREDFATAYIDNGVEKGIGYENLCYFPGFETPSYITISSINISDKGESPIVESMLGAGNNIYVSLENMYVANTLGTKTNIYKFSLDEGNITYLKKAEVKGNVLNQFSMDEYNGYFRIATTSYDGQMKNNVYILDDTLNLCGSVEDIAPDERIFSARFVGDRGYMVTFRLVDPLFVIDLADPYNPSILGQLKIPGYSDYIHPVDENHILGFGKDATGEGLYQGMKMALFDVSDVTNPIQKFDEIIGDRGTESPLLNNHKALLFERDLELLAFPITVREVAEKDPYGRNYGQLTFSGAYVYSFNTQDGFDLRGKITHISDDEMLKLGNYVDYNKEISRILYINNSLITVSNTQVFANDMDTVEYQGSVEISK